MVKAIHKTDLELMNDRIRANLINSLTGFKPANLIGTKNNDGQSNLAIISSAVHLGASPALIGLVFRPDTVPRHTLINIRSTSFCTLNHINRDCYKNAHQTSARFEIDESEFEHCNFTETYRDDFYAPFVGESRVSMGLKLVREIPITENGTHFLIMSIESIYLDEKLLKEDGYFDIESAGSIAVSGLDSYHSTTRLSRLSYAKKNSEPKSIG